MFRETRTPKPNELMNNVLCSAYGETPDEACENLEPIVDDFVSDMYMVCLLYTSPYYFVHYSVSRLMRTMPP